MGYISFLTKQLSWSRRRPSEPVHVLHVLNILLCGDITFANLLHQV